MHDYIIALIVAIPPTITAVAALVIAMRKIDRLNVHINSRMDQLLKVAGERERGEGRAEGIEAERMRQT